MQTLLDTVDIAFLLILNVISLSISQLKLKTFVMLTVLVQKNNSPFRQEL